MGRKRVERTTYDPVVLTDERMAELLADLIALEAGVDDRRGQAFSYATVIAAVAKEWDVSVRIAREFLSNWLAGKGKIDHARKPPLMVIHKDAWATLQDRD